MLKQGSFRKSIVKWSWISRESILTVDFLVKYLDKLCVHVHQIRHVHQPPTLAATNNQTHPSPTRTPHPNRDGYLAPTFSHLPLRFLLLPPPVAIPPPPPFPSLPFPSLRRATQEPEQVRGRPMGRGGAMLAVLAVVAVLAATAVGDEGAAVAKGKYRALFNFGDSLADAGNLLANGVDFRLATAQLPYGQTYFGRPTGRCSDGRLVIDHLAQEFGLPLLPPSKAKNASFAHGANFAITGATALDTPYFEARGLGSVVWNSGALLTQIQWFRDLKPFFCNSTQQECKEFFAKSLFVVGEFGGNDYNAPLFAGKGLEEVYKFMPDVTQAISDGVEQLIAEGAMELIVPGVMPTGCFPVYLNMLDEPADGYGSQSGCVRRYNTFSWVHNAHLKRALEKLRPKYPNVRIIYGDYYTPVIQFMLQPEKFGFNKQLPRACCGAPGSVEKAAYNFNVTAKCGEPGATACADPTTHWSWDGIHLTEAAYRHIAKGWLYGPFADQPIVQSS